LIVPARDNRDKSCDQGTPLLDEAKSKEFYVDFLGFSLDWDNRASGALFMQVSLDECVLHLSEHSGDACAGAAAKLHTDNIDEYVAQLVAKEYPPGVAGQHPGVAQQPWGSLDMVLVDPFGNRLIFTNASAPVLRGSSSYSQ
jgi:catechol 2,3-dioxygenase-like lactoylglutathione lyase family enzyme